MHVYYESQCRNILPGGMASTLAQFFFGAKKEMQCGCVYVCKCVCVSVCACVSVCGFTLIDKSVGMSTRLNCSYYVRDRIENAFAQSSENHTSKGAKSLEKAGV